MLRGFALVLALSTVSAVVPVLATPAVAQPAKLGPGATVVKMANDKIAKQLQQKAPPAQMIASVSAFLDIDQLGRSAMVNHWSKLKPNEQTDFLKVLRDLMQTNYLSAQQGNLQYTVDYIGESTNKDGHIVVNTKIKTQKNNRPFVLPVDYVLVKHGSALQAFDVITDGVGLVEGYQQTFDKVMKDKGFTGVMTMLNKKLAELRAKSPTNTSGSGSAPTPKKTP